MALVNCTECGHEISTMARICPNCGVTGSVAVTGMGILELGEAKRKARLEAEAKERAEHKEKVNQIKKEFKASDWPKLRISYWASTIFSVAGLVFFALISQSDSQSATKMSTDIMVVLWAVGTLTSGVLYYFMNRCIKNADYPDVSKYVIPFWISAIILTIVVVLLAVEYFTGFMPF